MLIFLQIHNFFIYIIAILSMNFKPCINFESILYSIIIILYCILLCFLLYYYYYLYVSGNVSIYLILLFIIFHIFNNIRFIFYLVNNYFMSL